MNDFSDGCYDTCSNCINIKNCCSSFDKINAPVLNKDELLKIKRIVKKNDFYEILSDNLFRLKLSDNDCIFFKNGKCSIYGARPLDCKLFPFDIIKHDLKYYLIIYKLRCINDEQYAQNFELLDSLIKNVKPWIEDYTDDRNYTKMKELKYRVIKEIEE